MSTQTVVERTKLVEAIALMGFDPNDIIEMTLTPYNVEIQRFERTESGAKTYDEEANKLKVVTRSYHVV
jgi:hypothetical protein